MILDVNICICICIRCLAKDRVAVLNRLNLSLDLQSLGTPCAQLYSLAETPQSPPPRIWAHIRERYWSAKVDDISLWPPGLQSISFMNRVSDQATYWLLVVQHFLKGAGRCNFFIFYFSLHNFLTTSLQYNTIIPSPRPFYIFPQLVCWLWVAKSSTRLGR